MPSYKGVLLCARGKKRRGGQKKVKNPQCGIIKWSVDKVNQVLSILRPDWITGPKIKICFLSCLWALSSSRTELQCNIVVVVVVLLSGFITPDEFEHMNTRGADTMMMHARKTHPKYRARYSYQSFVNQRYLKDPILDRIVER